MQYSNLFFSLIFIFILRISLFQYPYFCRYAALNLCIRLQFQEPRRIMFVQYSVKPVCPVVLVVSRLSTQVSLFLSASLVAALGHLLCTEGTSRIVQQDYTSSAMSFTAFVHLQGFYTGAFILHLMLELVLAICSDRLVLLK